MPSVPKNESGCPAAKRPKGGSRNPSTRKTAEIKRAIAATRRRSARLCQQGLRGTTQKGRRVPRPSGRVIAATVNHLTQEKIAHLDLTPPSGNGDSEQPYRLLWRIRGFSRSRARLERSPAVSMTATDLQASDQFKIGKLHLERRRPTPRAHGLKVAPHLVEQRL